MLLNYFNRLSIQQYIKKTIMLFKVMMPSPRMGAQMCVKHGLLYLYGGTVEDGDKQFTLNDMFALGMEKN